MKTNPKSKYLNPEQILRKKRVQGAKDSRIQANYLNPRLSRNAFVRGTLESLNPFQISDIKTFNPVCLNILNFEHLNLFVICNLVIGYFEFKLVRIILRGIYS